MSKNIDNQAIQKALQASRRGKALGIDSQASDFDAKNMPRVKTNGLSQFKVNLGLTLDPVGKLDLFAVDTFRPFSSDVRSGIKGGAAAEIDYLRAVDFACANPLRLRKLMITASAAKVIADTEISIVRRTPFGTSESERIALGSLVGPNAQQTDRVEVPIECEIDGATFVRVYVASYGTSHYIPAVVDPPAAAVPAVLDDQWLSVVACFDQVAERRASL